MLTTRAQNWINGLPRREGVSGPVWICAAADHDPDTGAATAAEVRAELDRLGIAHRDEAGKIVVDGDTPDGPTLAELEHRA